jgi:uncharacterized protein (DUF2141 family)
MISFAPRVLAALALSPLLAAAPAPLPSGTLVIQVGNVRNATGRVHVDLCPQALFLKEDCPYRAEAPAHPGVTQLVIRGVAPGRYGIQASHDENGNGKVDRGVFGIPKEGVGFSNDAPIRLSPPKWSDAVFAVAPGPQTVRFKLRYFTGASGPG